MDIPNHVAGDEIKGVWIFVKKQVWRKARGATKTR